MEVARAVWRVREAEGSLWGYHESHGAAISFLSNNPSPEWDTIDMKAAKQALELAAEALVLMQRVSEARHALLTIHEQQDGDNSCVARERVELQGDRNSCDSGLTWLNQTRGQYYAQLQARKVNRKVQRYEVHHSGVQ